MKKVIVFTIINIVLLNDVFSQFKIGASVSFDQLLGNNKEELTIGNITKTPITIFSTSININSSYNFKNKPLGLYSKAGVGINPLEFFGTFLLETIFPGFFETTLTPFFNYELGGLYFKNNKTSFSFSKIGMINKPDMYIFENNHIHGLKVSFNRKIFDSKFGINLGINNAFVRIKTARYDSINNKINFHVNKRILLGSSLGINYNF